VPCIRIKIEDNKENSKCYNILTAIFVISVSDFGKINLFYFPPYRNEYYKLLYCGTLGGVNNFKTEGEIKNSELKTGQAVFQFYLLLILLRM
jgi:hypothetical protein